MQSTQRARLHLVSRIEQRKDDWEWLEEIWNKIPETNDRYPFGLNKHIIMAERLTGLTEIECTKLTQAMIHMIETEDIKELLKLKLKI